MEISPHELYCQLILFVTALKNMKCIQTLLCKEQKSINLIQEHSFFFWAGLRQSKEGLLWLDELKNSFWKLHMEALTKD